MLTIAFTGHRPRDLYGYTDKDAWLNLQTRITNALAIAAKRAGGITVITGGAQGIDQCAFWAAHALAQTTPNISNHLYLPFKGQERKWLDTGLFSKQEFTNMCNIADKTIIVTPGHLTAQQIHNAYLKRNKAMVDACDILFAVTPIDVNDIPSKGGTAHAMRYAKQIGKPIYCIRP